MGHINIKNICPIILIIPIRLIEGNIIVLFLRYSTGVTSFSDMITVWSSSGEITSTVYLPGA